MIFAKIFVKIKTFGRQKFKLFHWSVQSQWQIIKKNSIFKKWEDQKGQNEVFGPEKVEFQQSYRNTLKMAAFQYGQNSDL